MLVLHSFSPQNLRLQIVSQWHMLLLKCSLPYHENNNVSFLNFQLLHLYPLLWKSIEKTKTEVDSLVRFILCNDKNFWSLYHVTPVLKIVDYIWQIIIKRRIRFLRLINFSFAQLVSKKFETLYQFWNEQCIWVPACGDWHIKCRHISFWTTTLFSLPI